MIDYCTKPPKLSCGTFGKIFIVKYHIDSESTTTVTQHSTPILRSMSWLHEAYIGMMDGERHEPS